METLKFDVIFFISNGTHHHPLVAIAKKDGQDRQWQASLFDHWILFSLSAEVLPRILHPVFSPGAHVKLFNLPE